MHVARMVLGGIVIFSLAALAQEPTPPKFDVASVKQHAPGDARRIFPQFAPGGRFVAIAPVPVVISFAYGLPINPSERLKGLPDWTRSREAIYDIQATGVLPVSLPAKDRSERMKSMVRALLADRFKLQLHHEMKEMSVYALVVDKGGLKLEKADIQEENCPDLIVRDSGTSNVSCHSFLGGRGRGLRARAVNMPDLATAMESWTDRPLVDKTGINGLYRIETTPWISMQAGPTPPNDTKAEDGSNVSDLPTIFTVFKRMGLRMESQKSMVDVVVIDHIERPDEN